MANTAKQMEMFGYTAEGAQQEADKYIDKDAAPAKDITFKDAAKFVAELTPVIGDAMAAKEVYDELQKDDPNYLLVGALGGAAIIGLIPGIGDAAASAIRAGAKKALDVAKRVEVDPNAVGTMGGNISLKPNVKPLTTAEKESLSADFQRVIDPSVNDNPDIFKAIFLDDEYAREILAEFRSPTRDITGDPAKLSEVQSLRNEIYSLTQEALKDLPKKVTVYRYGPLNEKDGVTSFTLDPLYGGSDPSLHLPWVSGKDYALESYTVKKSDILAAPDLIRDFGEAEIIIKNDAVKKLKSFAEGGDTVRPIAEQMKVFGYTPEGLDQEVEKYTGEAKKDFDESKLEEERRANHPLNDVPFFQRPINASTDDLELPTSDPDVRAFKNKFGETYTIAISPDQRNEYKKLRDGIINSIEGIKGYLEDPSLPSKEQVVDFVKGAAVGTLEQIKQSMSSGASYGDIFGTLAGVGAASTPFKVPEDSLRIFGGRGSKSGQKNYSEEFEALRLKKEGASPEEIEAATGRVETAPASSYVNSLQPTVTGPQFKFEIDDSQVRINGSYKTAFGTKSVRDASLKNPAFLEQVINHPVLFDEYPDLKDVRFVFDNINEKNGHLGHYDPKQNAIVLDNKYKNMSFNSPEFREIFFHELQHATQALDYKHGFLEILGANLDEIKRLLANTGQQLQDSDPYNYANLLKNKKIIKYRNDIINFYNKNKEALDNKSNPKLVNKFAKMFYFLDQEVYKEYLKGGVEIEARVAGARAKNLGQKPTESASSVIAKESDFTSFKKRLQELTGEKIPKFLSLFSTGGEKFTNTYYKDAMNFARYATGQDKDFNTGSDPNVSPMAGFTGDNPPTYERRPPKIDPDLKSLDDIIKMRQDDIRDNRIPGLTKEQETEIHNKHYSRPDYLNPDVTWASTAREYGVPVSRVQKAANRINMVNRLLIQRSIATQKKVEPDDRINLEAAVSDQIFFRMPVIEFVRNLDIPKKGILGSNFLKLVEKNPSIADSSFLRQKESINPTKRYSKKELQEALMINNEFFTAGKVRSGGSQFDRYQRQKLIGFRGGSEREYFEIPIRSFKSASSEVRPGEKLSFRPKRGTHFGDSAIAHVRGSIIKRKIKPGTTDTEKNINEGVNSGFNQAPEFSKIIGDQPFLLAEEIQSNLVKGGFLKTNFDEIYDEAVDAFDKSHGERAYFSMTGNVGDSPKAGDKKFRDLVKELDKENPTLPYNFIMNYGIKYGLEGEKIKKSKSPLYTLETDGTFDLYIENKLKSKGLLEGLSSDEKITARARFKHLYGNYRKRISERTKFQSTGNVKKALEEYDSPPITKTKQAVEESLKALIAKAAMENVNYIVFPNVARIKIARNKEFDSDDKSDMFYKMYFKELNEALVDLEKNYPVEIYSVDLPYDDKGFLTTPTSMLTSEVPDLYLDTFRKFVESNSPKLTNEVIPSNGTVLDITELVKKFKAESPRQFAEGGDTVRPEPKPETRPFPDVKPQEKPERKAGVYKEEYDFDGTPVEIPVIIFKDGERIAFEKALQTIADRGTANEPVVGMNTEDQVREFIEKRNPTREEFETYWYYKRLNKGGSVGEQMQMAFMNEGGLTDDGMNTDPVSGNEVPSGSMAEEVRDDIPAQLSEGEYVVPADVVRYYGVKFFEDLRDEAKRGLAEMEANGRIGGEPVPEGGPMNTQELSPEEMQAIREMMGMAEGGDVQNPYMQQQLLYSQPRPAPIDDQKDTVVDITNPVQNQMPVQNMAAGGQIQGYQTGGLEQDFLNTGQSAVNRGFVGFPLGATIFPSEKTGQTVLGPTGTQVATTDAINTAATAFTTVTLYGPNGEVVVLTLPTDLARYNELLALGYSTTPPGVTTTTTTGVDDTTTGDDDITTTTGTRRKRKRDKPDTDPNSWMKKFDYTGDLATNNLAQQTSDELKKAPVGGVIGAFINGQNAAQAAANIIILENNGGDPTKIAELKNQYKQFIKDTNLSYLPEQLINGDALAKDIVKNNIDIALNRDSVDINGEPIFKDDDEFNKLMQDVSSEGMEFDPVSRSYKRKKRRDIGEILRGKKVETTPAGVDVYQATEDTPRPVARPTPPTEPIYTPTASDLTAVKSVDDALAAKALEDKIERDRAAAKEAARVAARDRRKKRGRDRSRNPLSSSERVKDYTSGGQMYRGQGGRAEGGLMTKGKKKK